MKRLLCLLLLAGFADASCQTFWDYCYSTSYSNTTVLDLRGITGANIDGRSYVGSDLSSVNVTVSGTGTWTLVRYGPPNYPIFLVFQNTTGTGTVSLKICLNGSAAMASYPPGVFDTSGTTYPVESLGLQDFSSYYRRNWTFRNESDSIVNFTEHNGTLTVFCGTYSSFTMNLATALTSGGSLTIQTLEQPKYVVNFDGYARERNELDHYLQGNFYLRAPMTQYAFTLVDYTGQCNGLLSFKTSIGDSVQTVDSTLFGLSRDAYAFLDNSTPYDIQIDCNYGGVRDFGVITPGATLSRNIEVTNVQLSPAATNYGGNLSIELVGNHSLAAIYLLYSKTSGLVDRVNYTIYDASVVPMLRVHTVTDYNTSSGQMTYSVANLSHSYYAVAVFVNNGATITKSQTFSLRNESSRLVDFGLPPSVAGLLSDEIYKDMALIGMVVVGLGFSAIDAGYAGVIVVAWVLLMDLIGWLDIPNWLDVVIGFMALALLWGMGRRHDE